MPKLLLKTCSKCLKEKGLGSYGWKSKSKNRKEARCKDCKNDHERERYKSNPIQKKEQNKAWMKKYRTERSDKQKEIDMKNDRIYHRNLSEDQKIAKEKYMKSPAGISSIRKYRSTEKFRKTRLRSTYKSRERKPEQHRAHGYVYRAVRDKALIKPKSCEKCKRRLKLQGHHHNGYDDKHLLDVIWLCQKCHTKEHLNVNK